MKPYYEDKASGITIYHGDSLVVLPLLPPCDAVLTDPPFGVREDEWDRMDTQEFSRFSMAWLSQAKRMTSEVVTFCTAGSPIESLCAMVFPRVRRMVWSKPVGSQYAGASERGLWFAHESILHCHEGMQPKGRQTADLLRSARKRAEMSLGSIDIAIRGKKTGLAYRWEEAACLPTDEQAETLKALLHLNGELATAIEADRFSLCEGASAPDVFTHRTVTDGVHPCEKPVGLLCDLLRTVLADAMTIVDPFAGSGTTGIAAREMGRRCVLIEEDERYCHVIKNRLRQGVLFGGAA